MQLDFLLCENPCNIFHFVWYASIIIKFAVRQMRPFATLKTQTKQPTENEKSIRQEQKNERRWLIKIKLGTKLMRNAVKA